jgi:hypothetical protein
MARQALAAGLLDEVWISRVTHLRYRVRRR